MSREFAIVLFGATGFTGKFVLAELLACEADKATSLPIAIAGRNAAKLREVLAELKAEGRVKVLSNVDISNQESINKMCAAARLILNVVGPYRLYGEPVVRACAEAGTDYLDVCGEPEFMERMEFKYKARAAASGCYLASAAGYDSVPGDYGTVLAQREFKAPSVPCSVEAYLAVKAGPHGYKGHFATWQSAVLGIASVGALRKLRAQVKAAGAAPAHQPLGPRPVLPAGIEFVQHPAVRCFGVPFPEHALLRWEYCLGRGVQGADASVVRRTQAHLQALGQPTVHFTARFLIGTRFYAYLTAAVGLLMSTMARTSWGRALLLRFPGFFSCGAISHEGPSQLQIDTTRHETTLVARGYQQAPEAGSGRPPKPDRELVLTISGPDPGYKATAIFLVQAGMSLLLDRELLPAPGIYTVGALLCDTKYSDRLRSRGITIEKTSDTLAK